VGEERSTEGSSESASSVDAGSARFMVCGRSLGESGSDESLESSELELDTCKAKVGPGDAVGSVPPVNPAEEVARPCERGATFEDGVDGCDGDRVACFELLCDAKRGEDCREGRIDLDGDLAGEGAIGDEGCEMESMAITSLAERRIEYLAEVRVSRSVLALRI
jgi:hypothetical protein